MSVKKIIKIFEEILIIFLKGLFVIGAIALIINGVLLFSRLFFGISISIGSFVNFFEQLNLLSGFVTIILVGLVAHYIFWKTEKN
jgi:hypothetical protein